MVDTTTQNKKIVKPASMSHVDTWDVPVNADFDKIDAAFGNTTSLNVTSQSGTVVLAEAEYRPAFLSISGVLTAAVSYSIPSGVGGQWTVRNTTTGAFTLSIVSAGGGTSVDLAQGNTIVYSDGTNVRVSTPRPASPGTIFDWTQISGNTNAVVGTGYIVNTSGAAVTLTLPASPTEGDPVAVLDNNGTFAVNNLTVARNGNLIQGAASDLVCNLNGQSAALVFGGAGPGWRVSFP